MYVTFGATTLHMTKCCFYKKASGAASYLDAAPLAFVRRPVRIGCKLSVRFFVVCQEFFQPNVRQRVTEQPQDG